ncbi:hypothetical protein ATK36_6244 [Amycolatopsis sulphurea]|uniref:Uncharacterized protein n=1 Tax=Amycolatopsis sulphurea TaxID=76022 RepID=A0A2A9FJQ7_9PSEU|nr:hypothetical protein [Amycolatopsis sulphurea]PFG50981.1 hypothetical protein ATK36_6244 [Amycolatopsis sulphurea]
MSAPVDRPGVADAGPGLGVPLAVADPEMHVVPPERHPLYPGVAG